MSKQESLPCLPLGDRILVELITYSKSAGGIDLPEKQIRHGIVRAVGAGIPVTMSDVKVGLKVFLPRGDAIGDKFEHEGKPYLLIPSQYVAGIIP